MVIKSRASVPSPASKKTFSNLMSQSETQEQKRLESKKKDDLQTVMALLRSTEFEVPLQFENFRD